MTTRAQMRKVALAMPGAEENSHFDQPDFRVKNKIFACLARDGARGTLKLSPEVQAPLVASPRSPFQPGAGAWGRAGWTLVDLERVDRDTLTSLIHEAWRNVAPKRLIAAYDEERTAKPTRKGRAADGKERTAKPTRKGRAAKGAGKATRRAAKPARKGRG